MVLLLFTVMGRTTSEQARQPLRLPVQGAENAPGLVAFLEQHDVTIQPAPADPEAEVRAGNYDLVLVIPQEYREEFSANRPASIRLVMDESRQSSSGSIQRARALLEGYSSQIGALRLMARGVSPSVTETLAVERVDVSTPQSMAAAMLSVVPFFLIIAVFTGGMYLAIDTTAGERERGSLEPLLINPVRRGDLVLGKLAATLLFSLAAIAGTIIAFAAMLNLMPLDRYFGVQLSLPAGALAQMFLIAAPMSLLASAIQIIIATYTRSFKEAQNYLSFLPMVPGLPGLLLSFMPVKAELWNMLIPTFGQQLLINQVLRGEAVSSANILISAAATLAVGLVLVFVAMRLYGREQLLFTR